MVQKIDSIFDFCRSNRSIYNSLQRSIKSNNGIMPFIGADLIEFNYGTKEDFLRILIQSNGLSDKVDELITDDYLESLDRILNTLSYGLKEYKDLIEWSVFEDYYSANYIDWYQAYHEPINLIKWLNDGSAITVNFDKIYEGLNHNNHIDIATPYNKLLLNHFIRKDSSLGPVLFKVHGDLFSSPKEVLLTKDEFIDAYNNQEFLDMLRKWINQYVLLFVGIDIIKDTYLKIILEQTKQEGTIYYAIMGCEDNLSVKKQILTECTNMQIKPILFDINKPDSIRVILHKLLVDTEKKEWQESLDRGTLHYLYDDQLILGRDKQIQKLISFIEDNRKFLFCTINGKTISGKSKLGYEFAQTYVPSWRWYMIPAVQINDFINTLPSIIKKRNSQKKDTLIIFDDYSLYAESLDVVYKFILEVQKNCKKLRVIFISTDIKESNIARVDDMQIETYKFFYSKDRIYCNFYLSVMNADEIIEISTQYIHFRQSELGLEDFEAWRESDINALSTYVNSVLLDNPYEAILLSMIYAVKLVLNYLNYSTPETDAEYLQKEIYKYTVSEGTSVNYHTKGIDRKKLFEKVGTRLARAEKYSEKLNKNTENITKENNIVEIGEQAFKKLFEEDKSTNNAIGIDSGDNSGSL